MGLDQELYVVSGAELAQLRVILAMPEETDEEDNLKDDALSAWYEKHQKETGYRYWRKQRKTNDMIMGLDDLHCEYDDDHIWSFQSAFGTDCGYADEDFPSLKGTDKYYVYCISY